MLYDYSPSGTAPREYPYVWCHISERREPRGEEKVGAAAEILPTIIVLNGERQ